MKNNFSRKTIVLCLTFILIVPAICQAWIHDHGFHQIYQQITDRGYIITYLADDIGNDLDYANYEDKTLPMNILALFPSKTSSDKPYEEKIFGWVSPETPSLVFSRIEFFDPSGQSVKVVDTPVKTCPRLTDAAWLKGDGSPANNYNIIIKEIARNYMLAKISRGENFTGNIEASLYDITDRTEGSGTFSGAVPRTGELLYGKYPYVGASEANTRYLDSSSCNYYIDGGYAILSCLVYYGGGGSGPNGGPAHLSPYTYRFRTYKDGVNRKVLLESIKDNTTGKDVTAISFEWDNGFLRGLFWQTAKYSGITDSLK